MGRAKFTSIAIAALLSAILFGFYFTMSVVIMPGFDASDPHAALLSNQQIGRTTKGSLFFVALLGTPVAILAAILMRSSSAHKTGRIALIVGLLGWVGMLVVTLLFNVPLNGILDEIDLSKENLDYATLWKEYSPSWQYWNMFRVLASGITVVAVFFATAQLSLSKENII